MCRTALLSILVLFSSAQASEFHSVDDIAEHAVAALASNGQRSEAAVEPGLRLPRCTQTLDAVPISASVVEVGCASAGWRIFVPVRSQRVQQVYVLRRPLSAGEVISADAVALESRDVSRLPGGVLTEQDSLIGRSARRSLMAGSVLLAQDALSPRLVKRGDAVVLVSRLGSIEVRAAGKALAAAGVDESLNVENSSSRRVVQGRLLASGEVLVR